MQSLAVCTCSSNTEAGFAYRSNPVFLKEDVAFLVPDAGSHKVTGVSLITTDITFGLATLYAVFADLLTHT
jgi:hypothetical protein